MMRMRDERGVLLLLVCLFMCNMMSGAAGLSWGEFSSKECVQSGYRKYEAQLKDIKGSWEDACASKDAVVGPDKLYFNKPDACEKRGFLSTGGMWGMFYVRDTSCDPCWGSFKDDGCIEEGKSYRKYSSVLQNIKDNGDWEAWCAATPVVVKGNYFPKPSRCSKQTFLGIGISEWGEFHVYDPSCGAAGAAAVDAAAAVMNVSTNGTAPAAVATTAPWGTMQNDDYTCAVGGGGGDEPPDPRRNKISNIAGAISVIRGEKNAGNPEELTYALIVFLMRNLFRIIAPRDSDSDRARAIATTYYAVDNTELINFTPTEPDFTPNYAGIPGIYVPMVRADDVRQNNQFPVGTLAILELTPGTTVMIFTRELTGCCLVFGWNNANSRLYMGHVEPTDASSRAEIVNYVREYIGDLFPESVDQRMWFGGDDAAFGYGHERVNVIGIVRPNRIWIVLQSRSLSNPNQIRQTMLMDFQRL